MQDKPYPFDDFTLAADQIIDAARRGVRYTLLTGESGAGKSTLLAHVRRQLDRRLFNVVYFAQASLTAPGLIRVLATRLRVPTRRSQAETVEAVASVLAEDPRTTLLWIDEATNLPDHLFDEARTLAECELGNKLRLHLVITGLPALRTRLQAPALFPFWRRIQRRVEITGLKSGEVQAFARHHLGAKAANRITQDATAVLFEHSHGLPGRLVPYLDQVTARPGSDAITAETALSAIQQWDLP
jgi:type II secretory pathway predicted ATPase ExeA